MATVAMVLAIISFAGSCCIYLSIPCGCLAIIISMLSVPNSRSRSSIANAAIVVATVGIVATVTLTVVSFAVTIASFGSLDAFLDSYQAIYERMLAGEDMTITEMMELMGGAFSTQSL